VFSLDFSECDMRPDGAFHAVIFLRAWGHASNA
jgi:hypothetical protein